MMHYSLQSARNDRGVGALTLLGVTVLMFLFILGFAMFFFSSGVTNAILKVTCGEKALYLAKTAINEAVYEVCKEANTPGTDLFIALRTPVHDQDLGINDDYFPERTKYLVDADGEDKNVRIYDVDYEVPEHYRVYPYEDLEKYGRIIFRTKVKIVPGGDYEPVTCRLEQIHEFKVVAPLPPEPFDGVPFLMLVGGHLADIESDYRDIQEQVHEKCEEAAQAMRDNDLGELRFPFSDIPEGEVYRAYSIRHYPAFAFNADVDAHEKGTVRPGSLMDNTLYAVESPLELGKLHLHWPEDLDPTPSVSWTRNAGGIGIQEGPEIAFQIGDVFNVSLSGMASATVGVNGVGGTCTTSTTDPVRIVISQGLTTGPGNDSVVIQGAGGGTPVIFFRGDFETPIPKMENAIDDEIRKYEMSMKNTLDDYRRFWIPITEDSQVVFEEKWTSQFVWANYVPRVTHWFPTMDKFIEYVKKDDGKWHLDGIYLIQDAVTVDAVYKGNGVIVTDKQIVVKKARKAGGASQPHTLALISTDANITLAGSSGQRVEASLFAPGYEKTVLGLKGKTIYGNVVVFRVEDHFIVGSEPGQVIYDDALLRCSNATAAPYTDRYRFYMNRNPLVVRVDRKD